MAYVWAGYDEAVNVPGTGTQGREKASAIVIPWRNHNRVFAIRYRFLEAHNHHKQTAMPGSRFAGKLYGGQAWLGYGAQRASDNEGTRTLLICEGELNAISIWQAAHETGLDVLSLGSESQKLTEAMLALAQRYATVIAWADRPKWRYSKRSNWARTPSRYSFLCVTIPTGAVSL